MTRKTMTRTATARRTPVPRMTAGKTTTRKTAASGMTASKTTTRKTAARTDELAGICRALSAETRVRILRLLRGRALCVGALAARLDVTQGAVSQHLRILRATGLVRSERRGYYIHYRLDGQALDKWRRQVDELLASGDEPSDCCRRPTDTKGTPSCATTTRKSANTPTS